MATRGERWAFWLESELDRHGWQRADIPKRSQKKRNGRPIIDASRVSEWLNNNEAPRDPDILLELARIFGVGPAVVLNAAGWLPDEELDGDASLGRSASGFVEAVENDPQLIEEAKQHLLNQYQLLLRITPPVPATDPRKKSQARMGRLRADVRGQQRPEKETERGTGTQGDG